MNHYPVRNIQKVAAQSQENKKSSYMVEPQSPAVGGCELVIFFIYCFVIYQHIIDWKERNFCVISAKPNNETLWLNTVFLCIDMLTSV